MPSVVLIYSCIFVIGLVIGGIVNICVDLSLKRINFQSKDFSANDNAEFRWHDTFPVLSFLLLKGRCSSHRAKVNMQYPLVELANGVLYVIVFMANGRNLLSVLYCLMTSAFLVISIVDEKTLEIPLACNLFLGGLGLIACILDCHNIAQHIIGFVCVSLVLYLLYLISGGALIGGGDVKLMAAVGLLLGWKNATLAFFLACIIGSVIHVIRMKVSKAERVLAMGPYLCLGLWICALWGEKMIGWYLGLLVR